MMKIISSEYVSSSPDYLQCPRPDRPEYAFIGRSNVGKSTLINMICGKKHLAKISRSPGKTRLINHFSIESTASEKKDSKERAKWYLVDLPGYGFAGVSQSERNSWGKMIEGYLKKRENLIQAFLLLDSRLSPQALDLDFVNRLGEWRIAFTMVFTKSDKENQRVVNTHVRAFLSTMEKNWASLPPHLISSSLKQTGKKEILALIEDQNKLFTRRDS
jgi:GTP-binding protein